MQIVPGLHCLAGVGLGVNAYVWCPRPGDPGAGEPVIFDCGYPWHAAALLDSLKALGCPLNQRATIAVTHDDYDHTGALAELVAETGADVVAHRLEVPSIEGDAWREMPKRRAAFSYVLRAVTGLAYAARPKTPVQVTHPVEDGATIAGGWVAVWTPGHTPGHLAFWRPAERILIAGDALGSRLRGEIIAPIGSYSLDNEEVTRSVRKLAALEPDTICFGHGPEFVGNAAPALRRLARSIA
jgi:glyoxylase-like metal-dependent hydrolase (beta-lactamase superfamily II)